MYSCSSPLFEKYV
ncbi:unnamed protein product [Acanthoscelides obtectus]|uniref:Uncharacterized protein n=1 Tax=Acanthoscelides obtectus TaxID=200917 RepID=A0A9P0JLH2_ACAOB|nr:unnamed protein product [Acanthoscelides obtectus]CAK1628868.1 hypothetical protein AOBTE_LOCUS5442 [Acanthoscelides obtectus]